MSPRRTLDPTLDVVFKMLLTRGPESHELLVSLLTAVMRPPAPFAKVVVRNPELPSADLLDRGVVLDLSAQLEDGTLLDIEMQSDKRPAFRERALFYWARLYGGELERGEDYHALRPVVSVLFLEGISSPTALPVRAALTTRAHLGGRAPSGGACTRRLFDEQVCCRGTKVYTVDEARTLFGDFTKAHVWTQLAFGDLLKFRLSDKYQHPLHKALFALYPRWLVKAFGDRFGLCLFIEAVK